jgi:AcrR family transcriptional regulator
VAARPRTKLQEEQQKLYREKLLKAAQTVFGKNAYAAASVNDIAKEAGVSRSTFYRHFRNKIEITGALTDRLVEVLHSADNILLDAKVVDEKLLTQWIKACVALYRDNAAMVRTVREAAALDPAYFRDHALVHHRRTIRRFGQKFHAFKRASSADNARNEIAIRAQLLTWQLENFCYDIAITNWSDGIEIGGRLLARQYLAFLEEFSA